VNNLEEATHIESLFIFQHPFYRLWLDVFPPRGISGAPYLLLNDQTRIEDKKASLHVSREAVGIALYETQREANAVAFPSARCRRT
jgi:hypothetical protein